MDENIEDIDFVDELMAKAFNLEAPKMPLFRDEDSESAEIIEFKPRNNVTSIKECTLEELDFLNAAGKEPNVNITDDDLK
jgi:hypothetical protein